MLRFLRALVRPLLVVIVLGAAFIAQPASVDAYAKCNCTAYAKSRRPDLPMNLGNAKTWAARAKKQGFPVDAKPRVGDVIVLQPGVQGAHRTYGHVAYVTAVYGNKVVVREMNGGRGCRVIRDEFRVGKGVLFIHPKPAKKKTTKGTPQVKALAIAG